MKIFKMSLQKMMHADGDSPRPLECSAAHIEKVLYQQMKSLLNQANEVAKMRGAKSIEAIDFLFLMRKNRVKVRRLLDYFAVKDARSIFNAEALKADQPIQKSCTLQKCLKVLRKIDITGELTDRRIKLFDEVKNRRRLRAELVSRLLNEKRYLEYAAARTVSFTFAPKKSGFRLNMWLLSKGEKLPRLPKEKSLGCQILCYLARETVSQIMDLTFLAREDMTITRDPVNKNYPALFGPNLPQFPMEGVEKIYGITPVIPSEIEAALARYWSPCFYPFSTFSRNVGPQVHKRLLAC
ncbi:transcription initiation protein SPT3 homolog isoform X2 [Schistocerca americana]|uniref:transcription initiation protein SPT3 homolog isoform X2 n=1 Tax=Schistocerca americana TaxID=7009 RepID=UPI001F4F8803|nr:transcription initiation protein SPT3 homolog isoform X2 [Schistocerca americana]XP_049949689.1 transcription initiation protein SPT3 homolog isoform X2 [Schistocerca serialis cubense]